MCMIPNPLFSLMSVAAITCVLFFVPPAFAILTSSFYRNPDGIYSDTAAIRYFFTVIMLILLAAGDTPWQLYRMAAYYQRGDVTTARVVMRNYGRTLPYYQYQPTAASEEHTITADASLLRPETFGNKHNTFYGNSP